MRVSQHWQLEMGGIAFQVICDFILRRVAFRVTWYGETGKGAVCPRREQHQRIVAFAPAVTDSGVAIHELEAQWRRLEMIAQRQTRLSCSDNENVQYITACGHRYMLLSCTW